MGDNKHRRTTNWDAVAASSPVDRLASLAAAVGVSLNENATEEQILLAARRATGRAVQKDPNFINWTGTRIGRLTVVAYIGNTGLVGPNGEPAHGNGGSTRSQRGSLWLCRCVCGGYIPMRGRSLRKKARVQCNACEDRDYRIYGADGSEQRKAALLANGDSDG